MAPWNKGQGLETPEVLSFKNMGLDMPSWPQVKNSSPVLITTYVPVEGKGHDLHTTCLLKSPVEGLHLASV